MALILIVFMPKKMTKNLFTIDTQSGRMLYRTEGDGYCFYAVKSMKFFFIDKISGDFLLEHLGVINADKMRNNLEKMLGYSVADVFDEIKTVYLKKIPKDLIIP